MRLGSLILAGGYSQRMGRPKESLPFGEETMLQRIAATLARCTEPVIVVRRNDNQALSQLPGEIQVIADQPPSRGPLTAIITGLEHVRATQGFDDEDAMFVTGCDSPFLDAKAVQWLTEQLGDHRLVMPAPDEIPQPLCAIYRIGVLATARDLLERGTGKPRDLARAAGARVLHEDELKAFDPELRFLRNINTPNDYDRARDDVDGQGPY